MYDIVIKNGAVYDGLGSGVSNRDVGVKNGLIQGIGRSLAGKKEFDVNGDVVCPGFIDAHSHTDTVLVLPGYFDSKLRQGVTTEVVGNCGFSIAPVINKWSYDLICQWTPKVPKRGVFKTGFRGTYASLERKGLFNNIASYVGHGTLRAVAMGFERRRPGRAEMEKMKKHLRASMYEGVFGISSGLIYPPGFYSDIKELSALAAVAAEHGGIYATHIRGESRTLLKAVDEALLIGRSSGANVHISHLKCQGSYAQGKSKILLEKMAAALSEGVRVSADQYPYTASFTVVTALLPAWAADGGDVARFLKNRSLKSKIAEEMERGEALINGVKPGNIVIASCCENSLAGKDLGMLASKWKLTWQEAAFRIIELDRNATMVNHSMLESDLVAIMRNERVCVGSDGFALSVKGNDGNRTHPRNFGTFPRVLARYVRKKKVLSLEKGIYKMTALPASILGLSDRGVLGEGKKADIVVFDRDKIKDTSTFEKPFSYPKGIRYVFVNGKLALDRGKILGTFGRYLSKNS